MLRRSIFFIAVVAAAGCSAGEGDQAGGVASEKALYTGKVAAQAVDTVAQRPVLASQREEVPVVRRQVIRHANLSVRVPNVENAEKSVHKLVDGSGGYIESAESTDLDQVGPTLNMNLRVPVRDFDRLIEAFEGLGIRQSKKITSQDVTAQLVDMEARLRTMRVSEETYRGLLKRQNDLQRVIDLEQRLTEVRSQIESLDAQRKAMANLASLSNIELVLTQDAVQTAQHQDPNWVAETWGQSTLMVGGIFRVVVQGLIFLAVLSPLWVPILLLAQRAIRRSAAAKPPMPM